METDKRLTVEQCFKFNYSPDFKLGSNQGERLYKESALKYTSVNVHIKNRKATLFHLLTSNHDQFHLLKHLG